MKRQQLAIIIAGSVVLALAPAAALAQPPVITSFQGNGQLAWTNAPGTNGFAVEWAPTVTGPWSPNWQTLDSLISTSAAETVSVPMFYRVKQGFSLPSMRGVWIGGSVPPPWGGNLYFVTQEHGILSESSMFYPQSPPGFFTVDAASGRVTNIFMNRQSGPFVIAGSFAGANQINLDTVPGIITNGIILRLDDLSRCAGNWAGTLSPTRWTSSNDTGPHAVSFNVGSRGLVSGFTGFAGTPFGRLFALPNGIAVGFIGTAEWDSVNPLLKDYNQIKLSGTLSNNVIQGVYHVDEGSTPPRGTFTLTR